MALLKMKIKESEIDKEEDKFFKTLDEEHLDRFLLKKTKSFDTYIIE